MMWFTRRKVEDEEKAIPIGPTGTDISEKTLLPGSRIVSETDSEKNCPNGDSSLARERADKVAKAEQERKDKALTTDIMCVSEVKDYPRGYPRLAAFQSSDPSFSIYRSFDYLHSRAILSKQDELRRLEQKLKRIDDSDEGERAIASDEMAGSDRRTLLDKIGEKLVAYDELLMKARELNSFQRPSDKDYGSLRNWYARKNPLVAADGAFVKQKGDLITIRQGREWAGFDGLIESTISRLPFGLDKFFTTPELLAKSDDEKTRYYSPARVEKLVGVIITLIIFVLLILPVVAMYKLTSIGNRNSTIDAVGLLVVFTLLFSAAMSLLTKAKRHELFAASAAYCAVLVVFISNFSNDGR